MIQKKETSLIDDLADGLSATFNINKEDIDKMYKTIDEITKRMEARENGRSEFDRTTT